MTTENPSGALRLDGTGYGSLAPAATLGLVGGDFTVEAWVRIDAWAPFLPVLGTAATAEQEGLHLAVKDRKPYLGFYGADTAGTSDLDLATWYHLAWRYTADGGEQAVFVNGVLDGSATGRGPFLGTDTVYVGRYAAENFFRGEITELRVWHTARTEAEIRDHGDRRLRGDEAGLVGVWPFTDGAGETASNAKVVLAGRAPYGLKGRPTSRLDVRARHVLDFDGTNDYVRISNFVTPRTECTHEIWFKTTQADGGLWVFRGTNGGYERDLWLAGGDLNTLLWPHETISTTGLGLADGEWHHAAHVFGASVGGQLLYVDGVLRASGSTTTSDWTSQNFIDLGLSLRANPNYAKVQLAEFRVWGRTLSEREVRESLRRRLSGTEEGLLLSLPLDEGTAGPLPSLGSSGKTATLGGPTWLDDATPPRLDEPYVLEMPAAHEVTIPSLPSDGEIFAQYTFEAWISPEERPAPEGAVLLSYPDADGEPFPLLLLEPLGSLKHRFLAEDGTADGPVDTDLGSVPLRRWTHVAITHDGTTARTLVDGVEASSATVAPCRPFGFGFTLGAGFAGRLAEARLWNVARTAEEVDAGRHCRLGGDEAGHGGYWPFDEPAGTTARDLASPAHEAQTETALRVVTRDPFPGEEAVDLDGAGTWIEVPHSAELQFAKPSQSFTVEVWVRADREQPEGECVVLEEWGGGGGFPYALRYRPATGCFVFARSSGAAPFPEVVSDASFGDGGFHHLAAVRDGASLKLYVDGVLAGEATDTVTSTIRGSSPLFVGGRARRSHFLKGSLTELRVWRRALSAGEIRAALASRLAGDEADLAGYWPLDAADVASAALERLEVHDALSRPAVELAGGEWTAADGLPLLGADEPAPDEAAAVDPEQMAADLEARLQATAEELRLALEEAAFVEKKKAELVAAIDDAGLAWIEEREQIRLALEAEVAERQAQLDALDAAEREADSALVDTLLDDLVKKVHAELERARLELDYDEGDYELGRTTVELKYLAGAGGRGAVFPDLTTEVDGERLSVLSLTFASAEALAGAETVTAAVPSVVGLTGLLAERKLQEAGFRTEVYHQAVPAPAAVGLVVTQLPLPDAEVEPGSLVRLFLGKASLGLAS